MKTAKVFCETATEPALLTSLQAECSQQCAQ